jgi:alcohol dehydrogenase class IV
VLISPEHRVKVSLRSPLMLPLLAVVDSELTHTLPPSITASTGMDALTQLLEPFVCKFANPFTDSFCRDGIRRVAASLFHAFRDGNNAGARENMALASLFGGLALANSGLGAVHGLAAVVGGMLPIPHGMVCARLLPHVMEANIEALRRRSEDSLPLARYEEIAYLLTGRRSARAQDGIAWVQSMCHKLAIPNLSTYGMKEEDIPIIATQAQKASSMKGNPITLSWDELTEILAKAMVSKI